MSFGGEVVVIFNWVRCVGGCWSGGVHIGPSMACGFPEGVPQSELQESCGRFCGHEFLAAVLFYVLSGSYMNFGQEESWC